jgi:hypothetical protein
MVKTVGDRSHIALPKAHGLPLFGDGVVRATGDGLTGRRQGREGGSSSGWRRREERLSRSVERT